MVAGLSVVAAALLLTATVAATGIFEPDPESVQAVKTEGEQHADVHLEGWRPVLNAESVRCIFPDGRAIDTFASDFPLDQPLTVDRLIEECTTGNDLARTSSVPPTTNTSLCEAVLTDAALQPRLQGARADVGNQSDRPGMPVVFIGDVDCHDATGAGTEDLQLRPFGGVDALNRAREAEIELEATALDRCLSHQQAINLAQQTADWLDQGWYVVDYGNSFSDCLRVDLTPEVGAVTIWDHDIDE